MVPSRELNLDPMGLLQPRREDRVGPALSAGFSMRDGLVSIFTLAAAGLLAVLPAEAAAPKQKPKRTGANPMLCGKTPDKPDTTIESCAAVIADKRYPPLQVAEARYFRSLALQKKGEGDKAMAELDEAIRLAPGFTVARIARASAHIARRAWEQALADVEAILAEEPDEANALALRGSIRLVRADHQGALEDFNAALEGALPAAAAASVHHNRGIVHERLGARDKAVADFRKALAAKPSEKVRTQALQGLARHGADQGVPPSAASGPGSVSATGSSASETAAGPAP